MSFELLLKWNLFFLGILVFINLLPIIFPLIHYFFYKDRYKKQRFSIYVTVFFIITLIIGSYFVIKIGLNYLYIFVYVLLFATTRVFIHLVRTIKEKSETKSRVIEFEFFKYMSYFAFILLSYIVIFSLFYILAIPSNFGYMSIQNKFISLDMWDAIYYSGFTFFSMEFNDVQPQGLLKAVSLIEVFVAQIVIISFIGILASELFKILVLYKRKNE